jgi:Fur family ferric uptake transcriptional regulator
MMGDLLKFEITHHSLNLYGSCTKLKNDGKCESYNNQQNLTNSNTTK